MAKKKTPKKKGVKKKSTSPKKKVSKKSTSKKSPIKKKITSNPIAKKVIPKTNSKRSTLEKKKKRIIVNLIGFLVVLILSIVFYSVTGNYVSEIIFLTLIILSLVICIALFLALVSVLLARKSKKR